MWTSHQMFFPRREIFLRFWFFFLSYSTDFWTSFFPHDHVIFFDDFFWFFFVVVSITGIFSPFKDNFFRLHYILCMSFKLYNLDLSSYSSMICKFAFTFIYFFPFSVGVLSFMYVRRTWMWFAWNVKLCFGCVLCALYSMGSLLGCIVLFQKTLQFACVIIRSNIYIYIRFVKRSVILILYLYTYLCLEKTNHRHTQFTMALARTSQ